MTDNLPVADELLRRIAMRILESQFEDLVYLTVVEMTDDMLDAEEINLSNDELDKIYDRVDELCAKADVKITLPE